jgi:hypothetical protein
MKLTDKEIKEIQFEKQARDKFSEYRKNALLGIPEIASRVFALRGKCYMGCGFHYGLEKLLGSVIKELNTYEKHFENNRDMVAWHILVEVLVEELYERTAEAENSLENNA